MKKRILSATFAAGLIAALSLGTAARADVTGTLSVGGIGNSISGGADLSDNTSLSATLTVAENNGTGDYSGITAGTIGSGFTLDLTNLSSFTFSMGGFTFSSNAESVLDEIVSRSAASLVVYLRGDFDGTDSSLNFSATDTGGAISSSFTLNTPAVPPPPMVPEPSGVVMGLTSLAVCGMIHRLRRRRGVMAAA